VYVYLDVEEGVDGTDASTKERGANGEHSGGMLRLADVASLIAVAGAGTYVVGLFAFWYPISTTYTGDFATAWYATSLVSRNVIVGHGVQQLLLPYLALMLFMGAMQLLYLYTDFRFTSRDTLLKRATYTVIITVTALLQLIAVFWGLLWYYLGSANPVALFIYWTTLWGWLPPNSVRAFIALGLIFSGLLYAWVAVLASIPRSEGHRTPTASSFGERLQTTRQFWLAHRPHSIAAVTLFFVAFFVFVLLISLLDTKPPLSTVEVSGQRPVKGALLTHSDGFWYVFERQEDKQKDKQGKGKPEAKLVAINDDKVKDAEVLE